MGVDRLIGMDHLVGMDPSFDPKSVLIQHSMTILSGGGGLSGRAGPPGGDGSKL